MNSASSPPNSIFLLSHKRFLRHWRFLVYYNSAWSIVETSASFVFFVVLQAFFLEQPGDAALEPGQIGKAAAATALAGLIFGGAQRWVAVRSLGRNLVRYLPPAFFDSKYTHLQKESSVSMDFRARMIAYDNIRRTMSRMAWAVVLIYSVWGLSMCLCFYVPPGSLTREWEIVAKVQLICTSMGGLMARSYYLRLRQLDLEPLLSLEWREAKGGTSNSENYHLSRQLTVTNRRRFRLENRSRTSRLHRALAGHLARKLHRLTRLFRRLGLHPYPPKFMMAIGKADSSPDDDPIDGENIGPREVHGIWEAVTSIVIVTFFFAAVVRDPDIVGTNEELYPWVVAAVMAAIAASLQVPRLLRFMAHFMGHDSKDPEERVTAEAYGLISSKNAEDEFFSGEGQRDEKTDLLRYGVFYRAVIDVLLQYVRHKTADATGTDWVGVRLDQKTDLPAVEDFSLILIDIDNFKVCNSILGYLAADAILEGVAKVLIEAADEQGGIAGRYGGEEFCILLPKKGLGQALEVADRIRRVVLECVQFYYSGDSVSVRGGSQREVLWSYSGKTYGDDSDPENQYPNIKRAKLELEKYRRDCQSIEGRQAERRLRLAPSLEATKEDSLGRLVSGCSGSWWSTTVSVAVADSSDFDQLLGGETLHRERAYTLDYVRLFRWLFARLNTRIDRAKAQGRNRVIGR